MTRWPRRLRRAAATQAQPPEAYDILASVDDTRPRYEPVWRPVADLGLDGSMLRRYQ